jgi:hypothetical protein
MVVLAGVLQPCVRLELGRGYRSELVGAGRKRCKRIGIEARRAAMSP